MLATALMITKPHRGPFLWQLFVAKDALRFKLAVSLWVIFFSLIQSHKAHTQSTSSTWFNDSQSYIVVPVGQDGIYKVPADVLIRQVPAWAGQPVDRIQLYALGRQQPIDVLSADNLLDAADTVLFIGRQYRGELERFLYRNEAAWTNRRISQYSDTLIHYVTLGSTPGLRMARRVSQAPASQGVIASAQFEGMVVNRAQYALGAGYFRQTKIHQSFLEAGEGWTGTPVTQAANFNLPVGTALVAVNQDSVEVEVLVHGRSTTAHNLAFATPSDPTVRARVVFTGFSGQVVRIRYPYSSINSAQPQIRITPTGAGSSFSIGYIHYRLRRALTLGAQERHTRWTLPASSGRYIRLQGTAPSREVIVAQRGDSCFWLIPSPARIYQVPSGGAQTLWISRQAIVLADSNLRMASFGTPSLPADSAMIIISSRRVLQAGAEAYQSYRQRTHPHGVALVYVEDLYHRYGFGLAGPLAVRRYFDTLRAVGRRPAAVLLLGKGVQMSQLNPARLSRDLVPTLGVPASDVMFTWAEGNRDLHPTFPLGRLAVQTNEQIYQYLDKLAGYESPEAQQALWRKRVLHLSGGLGNDQIGLFKNIVERYRSRAEGPQIGASVQTYSKQSESIIEAVRINGAVNEGLSLITMFGHSAATTTDIDIGMVSDTLQGFSNVGRYPVILINGCYAGHVYDPVVRSLNEDWVLTPRKGAIGFIGNMDEGLPALLDRYSTIFYQQQFESARMSHQPIGRIIQDVSERYINELRGPTGQGYVSPLDSIMVAQMVYHGDPLLRLFPWQKPDLAIADTGLVIQQMSNTQEGHRVVVRAQFANLGRFTGADSLSIAALHTLPDGGTAVLTPVVRTLPARQDQMTFVLEGPAPLTPGAHKLRIVLDYLDQIVEEDEGNNTAEVEFFLPPSSIYAVLPQDHALIGQPDVTFITQTTIQTRQEQTYRLEVDTARRWQTPMISRIVRGQGIGRVTARLPLLQDSTVYFWRMVTLEGDSIVSRSEERSFIFIAGTGPGYGSRNRRQFARLEASGLVQDTATGRWTFRQERVRIDMSTTGSGLAPSIANSRIDIDGVPYFYGTQNNCSGSNRMLMLRLRQCQLRPYVYQYQQPVAEFWRYSCGRVPAIINFVNDANLRTPATNFFKFGIQQMRPGDHFLAMSHGRLEFNQWETGLLDALNFVGAVGDTIGRMTMGEPLILAGVRTNSAAPGSGMMVRASRADTTPLIRQQINLSTTLSGCDRDGQLETGWIGPSQRWRAFTYQARLADTLDRITFTMLARTPQGRIDTIYVRDGARSRSLDTLSAETYPFVRIIFHLTGAGSGQPPQLKFWYLNFDQVVEGLIDHAQSTFEELGAERTLREGARLSDTVAFTNVSSSAYARPIPVQIRVTNQTTGGIVTYQQTLPALAPGQTGYVPLSMIETLDLGDRNQILVLVNLNGEPELSLVNNVAQLSLNIVRDSTRPYLEVALDGRLPEALNLTGPRPTVTLRMHDPNNLVGTLGRQHLDFTWQPCTDCPWEPVPEAAIDILPGATPTFVEARIRPTLERGRPVQIRIQGTDRTRQTAGLRPSQFGLVYRDSLVVSGLTLFPVPVLREASLRAQLDGVEAVTRIEWRIYDRQGRTLYRASLDERVPPGPIVVRDVWPIEQRLASQIQAGIYLIQVRFIPTVGPAHESTLSFIAGW